jgi:hypothetical protein
VIAKYHTPGRRWTLENIRQFVIRYFAVVVFLGGLALFTSTLAPSVVFGDPTEYTLMPHLWAVLHPPGYAFMTLLVKVWQMLVPIGTLAYRTNLLAASAGAMGGVMVYLTPLPDERRRERREELGMEGEALLAALSLFTASNYWQHSIHTNAHIVTAMLASVSICVLLRWRATQNDRWLYAFGIVAGLSVTQHPLLVFGFPAYAIFILLNRPRLTSLLLFAGCGLLGLAPWLYFPIRSAIQPPPAFGPHDMNTLDGFLNLTLARGLAGVNLFHFGPGEQWHRLIVLGSLLQLQYAWPLILLAVVGLIWLARRDWRTALLLGLHLLVNLAFTLNTVQDVMAYLLPPLVTLSILIGAGARALRELPRLPRLLSKYSLILLLLFPFANLVWLYPRISLRELRATDAYTDSVFAHFTGKGRHAVLLSDWEHATPLWYREYVDGQRLDPNDATVVYVNKPFVDAVWENIDAGPIYLLEYNPAILNTGFRLRAEGPFYRLEPPLTATMPEIPHPVNARFGPVELLGYDMLTDSVEPGGVIPILLYTRAPEATGRIVHPFARLGAWEHRFTTDSHWLTPYWQAGEIIVERWEVIAPLEASASEYPLIIGFSDLITGEDFAETVSLGSVRVISEGDEGDGKLAANFGQRVGVDWVKAWDGGSPTRTAPWSESLVVRPGESIELRIKWRALHPVESSYTVFVHLLNSENALIVSKDYTPLGGAWPTMLWFPKWLAGQSAVDPYALTIPAEAAPGEYYIEIGLYGLRSVVRVPAFDAAGNLAGDRFVLGGVTVAP